MLLDIPDIFFENFVKNIIFSLIARVTVIVLQLLYVKLYTNCISTEQLGIFFFLMTVSYFANAILFVPVDYFQQSKLIKAMSNFGGGKSLFDFNVRLVNWYLFFALLLSTLCVFILPSYSLYVVTVLMLALVLYIVQALRNVLNNLGYNRSVTVSYIQEAFFKVAILYLFLNWVKVEALKVIDSSLLSILLQVNFKIMTLHFFADLIKPDAVMLLNAWLLSLLFTASYLMFMANKRQIFMGEKNHYYGAKEVFVFSYPFSVSAVCNWLQLQGYRLILVPLGYSEVVGIFATLSSIGSSVIAVITLIYSQQFVPRIYNSEGRFTANYLKGALLVALIVTVMSYFCGGFLVDILTNQKFMQNWEIMLFGLITDASNLFAGALVIHATIKGNTKSIMTSAIVGLAIMLISFLILFCSENISLYTVGFPLLISQWCVVFHMLWKFSNSSKIQ